MRKLIITLLALSLMLCCLSAQAESKPMDFKEIGINLDFGNVLEASSNYMDLWAMGILSRDPFVAIMNLQYYALDREFLTSMAENFDSFSECLENAELYAPVDPEASLPGQVLSFETTDIDGNAVSSADLFKDNKITMVNVWGTWCHNCVGEMEALAEIHTRLQAKGCGVVGVEYEQKPIDTMKDEIRAFLEEKGVNYPNVIMPRDNEIINGIAGFPTTFFVDSEGKILTLPISGAQVDAYEPTVDQLLADEAVDTDNNAGAIRNDSGAYHVVVYDMDGNPVEGAVIQLCDETTCAFQPTDANGVATFSVEAEKVYDVHVLMAPEGYVPDDDVYKTLDTFSDVNIFLEKAA